MNFEGIEIKWLGNAGFLIKNSYKTIYIDPYNISDGLEKADIVLLTHSHYDHCSVADLLKIVKPGTLILCSADCQSKLTRFDVDIKMQIVEPGQNFNFFGMGFLVMPAYNTDKPFHPRDETWGGFLIKLGDVLVYHAGDTDKIPEMQKLTGHKQADKKFVALLPVGGRFTMSAEEAVEAAKIIKPDLVVPMHYGAVAGSEDDANEFKELCEGEGINVEVLGRE